MTDPNVSPGSPPPNQIRPSDADRQAIAERLRQAVDEGRLDLMEYDRRLRASEQAATMADLQAVVADLPAPATPPEQVLLQLGDMTVTSTTIYTPSGPIPLRGAQWMIQDHWTTTQKIPTWAIVLAIVGFFCLTIFSLLFLLAKETVYQGVVTVTVTNAGRQYAVRLPVNNQQQVHHYHQQVNYLRSVSAA
ncbi:MAG TPA: DUF1707 domain-containing protein [Natronosporangium sp.]|nr:DUF1707 domain-containing protein [Natronosporangium sp.]